MAVYFLTLAVLELWVLMTALTNTHPLPFFNFAKSEVFRKQGGLSLSA
jgi:hypothetical protein